MRPICCTKRWLILKLQNSRPASPPVALGSRWYIKIPAVHPSSDSLLFIL